ncbi:hypothetical protein JM654_02785 [Microbacterium oxydans]|nr:hypothetical protein [Microbacterium oxydans]
MTSLGIVDMLTPRMNRAAGSPADTRQPTPRSRGLRRCHHRCLACHRRSGG